MRPQIRSSHATARRPFATARTPFATVRRPFATAAVLTILMIVFGSTNPAGAHGAEGVAALARAEQTGALTVEIEVGVLYANDDDLAEDATVVATLTSGADTVGPIDLPKISGARYGATVTVPRPGSWEIAVTSVEPDATVTGSVEVTDSGPTPTPSESTPTGSTPSESTSTSTAQVGGRPNGSNGSTPPATTPTDASGEGGSGTTTAIIVALIVAAVAVSGLGLLTRSRKGTGEQDS